MMFPGRAAERGGWILIAQAGLRAPESLQRTVSCNAAEAYCEQEPRAGACNDGRVGLDIYAGSLTRYCAGDWDRLRRAPASHTPSSNDWRTSQPPTSCPWGWTG